MQIGRSRVGEKVPLVTLPIGAPPGASITGWPSRGIFFPSHSMQTRRRASGFPIACNAVCPTNSPRFNFTANPSPASSGFVSGVSSWP